MERENWSPCRPKREKQEQDHPDKLAHARNQVVLEREPCRRGTSPPTGLFGLPLPPRPPPRGPGATATATAATACGSSPSVALSLVPPEGRNILLKRTPRRHGQILPRSRSQPQPDRRRGLLTPRQRGGPVPFVRARDWLVERQDGSEATHGDRCDSESVVGRIGGEEEHEERGKRKRRRTGRGGGSSPR